MAVDQKAAFKSERSAFLVKPPACYWCLDAKRVAVTPFTTEQHDNGTVPVKECPYCKGK
jgi:hypothetical protein